VPQRSYSSAWIDPGLHQVAGLQLGLTIEIDVAVDLRRVGGGAAGGAVLVHLVDQDGQGAADLLGHAAFADLALRFHEAVEAVLLLVLVDMIGDLISPWRPRPARI
jgi:hypothetical protein